MFASLLVTLATAATALPPVATAQPTGEHTVEEIASGDPPGGRREERSTAAGGTGDATQVRQAGPGPILEPIPPPPAGERDRVAVLLLPIGDLDPTTTDNLTELLIGGVAARGGVTIVGKEELQAQLGQGDAGTLECIGSIACMGRVGVQLALTEMIAGTLARRGDAWMFNLNRVDVRSGQTLGRVFREVNGDLGVVADALSDAVPDLYPVIERPATLVLRTVPGAEVAVDGVVIGAAIEGTLRLPEVPPGQHHLRVSAPGRIRWARVVRFAPGAELHLEAHLRPLVRRTEAVHPLVWIGGGIAAAAMGGAIALGVLSQERLELSREARWTGEVTRAEAVGFFDTREREAIAADILFSVAGAAAIVGAVALFFPTVTVEAEDELGVIPVPGGLVLQGGF